MFKKILSLSLCLILCLPFAGCGKKKEVEVDTPSSPSEQSPAISDKGSYINPLTGEDGLDSETAAQRPVAIMVNNISTAQPVQTGLNKADIVYETEVEGGITRLMAVYKDLKSVPQIGSVRSARYVYIDLAAGHDAVFAYHGIDNEHATPHLNVVKNIVLGTNNGGARISNGLASQHTLYAYGDKFWESIKKTGNATLSKEQDLWQSFTKKDAPVKFEATAQNVTVPFSASYKTVFKYNAETGKYTRFFKDTERKDYKTGESVTVKNVFVLNTTISDMSPCTEKAKGKSAHRNVSLTSGDGYYFVNGTYTKIKWTKGNANSPFKFTKEDGSVLAVNQGNSWVCIADSSKSQPVIG